MDGWIESITSYIIKRAKKNLKKKKRSKINNTHHLDGRYK